MGLIRKAIIVGGILFALPSPPVQMQLAGGQPSFQSSTFATLAAAADTVADFKGFCDRRPQACVTGQYIAFALESKAKYYTRLAYEWANPNASVPQEQTAQAQALPPAPQKAKPSANLRLATLAEPKPNSIADLLRQTAD